MKLRRKDGSIREYLQPYAKKKTLEASAGALCLVREGYTRTARFKNRAEKMIWPSEYRSMADAWELSGDEGRDKLR